MTAAARPDRETLLLWISAFFDGELTESEEALLFDAMAEDPALEEAFLALERQSQTLEQARGPSPDFAAMADAVMAAVAPEGVDEAGAPLLLSAVIDGEASAAQEARFVALAQGDERTAEDALAFLHASEGVSHAIAALPESPAVEAAVASLPALISARVANDERAAELLSALADDALDPAEHEELLGLVAHGAAPELSFLHASEAVAYALRAPSSDPAAARAGAAALHAIEADALRARADSAAPRATAGGSGAPSLLERLKAGFGGFLAPVAAAACAALVFVALEGAPGAIAPSHGVMPPEDWARAFLPLLESEQSEDLLAAADAPLEVLADNGDTEVQAIDSGTHMAAVFSTEASAITVIWVPEPLDALSAPTESGT